MSAVRAELIGRGIRALRRSAVWWGAGIVVFVLVNAAFWPSLEGTEALESFEDMGSVLEAFGAENIATPRGYLDGQVFALMLPLLLSGMAIAASTAITSGDEDAGRLELLHALPVARRAVWLARWWSFVAVMVAVTAVVSVVTVSMLPVFSLDGVGVGAVVGASFGCALLATFHASVAYAASGSGWTRGRAVGVAVAVMLVGYVLNMILPLADSLRGARRWSPWYWAIGEQPVSEGVSWSRGVLLVLVTAALVAAGTAAVDRRDIRTP